MRTEKKNWRGVLWSSIQMMHGLHGLNDGEYIDVLRDNVLSLPILCHKT